MPGAPGAVISARDLGIKFHRNRRRNLQLREMLFRRRTTAMPKGEFWALRDVTFDVPPGEAVGVIGANGGGKSTLLNLVAGVLLPDEGFVEVTGGVAPLIEVTGGFVGDLTGRDNVWLTAGLHGLSKAQIAQRFEGMIDFAGPQVRAMLDTPFRHYSSGMKVRLGFSVVTSLDEPIVLVDEVLAVGDRDFRQKCYKRMEEMLSEGRTLFLVSHSEADLRRFCTRGLYLRSGELVGDGALDEVLSRYEEDSDRSRV